MTKITTFTPEIHLVDGQPRADSRDIARHFEKQHKDVLRAIQALDCTADFNRRNFTPVSYMGANGQKRPMVEITRDGFAFLVMGFTGKKAARWKEAYIAAFNRMAHERRWLSDKEARQIQQAVSERAAALCGDDKGQRKARRVLFDALKDHFEVPRYRRIPGVRVAEALELVGRFEMSGNSGQPAHGFASTPDDFAAALPGADLLTMAQNQLKEALAGGEYDRRRGELALACLRRHHAAQEAGGLDRLIDYINTRLLDGQMMGAAHNEAAQILEIAKALRGDAPEIPPAHRRVNALLTEGEGA